MLNLRKGVSNQIFSASYKSGLRRVLSVLIAEGFHFEEQFEIKGKEGRYIMVGEDLRGLKAPF